ncbi:hypothetical protein ABZX92_44055 [Lentzea sp. NPDC006480]|uniref:hypothetical protein n=1 Tax=Lentzea sp. NPDC006480 TaxID=3157176 RepID=UPI0033A7696A
MLTPAVNRGVTVTPDMVLRCQRLVDNRFTGHTSYSAGENLTQDVPPKLHVFLYTLIGTKAKVDYLIWYEKPDSNRPPPDPKNPCSAG